MIRISLPYIYKLATELEPVAHIQAGTTLSSNFFTLITAQIAVEALLQNSVFASTLRSCRASATELLDLLKRMNEDDDHNREIRQYETIFLAQRLQEFKTALLAELGVLPSYFVTQKGGFDTLRLLEEGQALFPYDLHSKVPEATYDIQQAAMALAYEIPTASGFHAFRAVESVLRRYYSYVSGGKPAPKVRNIGVYIKSLRKANCGDEIILAALEQLTKLHRNPLIHPEAALTVEEAISTLGMARSVVAAMLNALPLVAPTTTTS